MTVAALLEPASANLAPWLAFAGSVVAAVIAAAVAVTQARRGARAQRDLELEKVITARRENELAAVRRTQADTRQAQVRPFLEALQRAVLSSYPVVSILPVYVALCPRVSTLRWHADSVLIPASQAMEEVSHARVGLLLGLPAAVLPAAASSLADIVETYRECVSIRADLLSGRGSASTQLAVAHAHFINESYGLLVSIAKHLHEETGASIRSDELPNPAGLAELLKKTAVDLVPYGRPETPCWLAIWDFRTDLDDEALSQWISGDEDIPRSVREWMHEVEACESIVKAELTIARTTSARTTLYFCCEATFGSALGRDDFVENEIPRYRKTYPAIWIGKNAPTLITVD